MSTRLSAGRPQRRACRRARVGTDLGVVGQAPTGEGLNCWSAVVTVGDRHRSGSRPRAAAPCARRWRFVLRRRSSPPRATTSNLRSLWHRDPPCSLRPSPGGGCRPLIEVPVPVALICVFLIAWRRWSRPVPSDPAPTKESQCRRFGRSCSSACTMGVVPRWPPRCSTITRAARSRFDRLARRPPTRSTPQFVR